LTLDTTPSHTTRAPLAPPDGLGARDLDRRVPTILEIVT
jgi:hypothetical protein